MKFLKRNIKKLFFKKGFFSYKRNDGARYRSKLLWSTALLWSIVTSIGFGLIYSIFARIDEVVISRGELQAKGSERPIKAPYSGLIQEIKVQEGEKVKVGQTLIQLDKNIYQAKYDSLNTKLASLKLSREFASDIVDRYSILKKEGGISLVDYLNEENKLQKLNYEILQIKSELKGLQSQIEQTKLVSPANGTVFNLIPSNSGYFAKSGETLLMIVPEGELEAKIFILNKDIGFIMPNMKAEVRVDAYPFSQFGSIDGQLNIIGNEVLPGDQQNPQSRFPAVVKLNKQYLEMNGKKYKIKSGQSVSVNLIVREKPVITLLTDSIENAFDALRGIKSNRK